MNYFLSAGLVFRSWADAGLAREDTAGAAAQPAIPVALDHGDVVGRADHRPRITGSLHGQRRRRVVEPLADRGHQAALAPMLEP